MNPYGRIALDHDREHHPDTVAAIPDPIEHYAAIGEQTQASVTRLRDELLGSQKPGENPDEFRRRGHRARRTAEEIVLTDLLQPDNSDSPTQHSREARSEQLSILNEALSRLSSDWTEAPDLPT